MKKQNKAKTIKKSTKAAKGHVVFVPNRILHLAGDAKTALCGRQRSKITVVFVRERVTCPQCLKKLAPKQAKTTKPAKTAKQAKTTKPAPVAFDIGKPTAGARCLPADLTCALGDIKRATARKSTLPVLGTFHLVADLGSQRIKITATNLELAEWRWIPASVKEDFGLCLPYEVEELARHLSDEAITLTVDPKIASMKLTQTGFKATLKGIDPQEYPAIAAGGSNTQATFELSREQLAEIVARVLPCAASDESRPVLTAVFVNVRRGTGNTRSVDFATADGYRLAVVTQDLPVTIAKPNPEPVAAIVEAKAEKKTKKARGKPAATAQEPDDTPASDAVAAKPATKEKPYYEYSCLIPPVFFVEALKIAQADEVLTVEVCAHGAVQYVTCQNSVGGVTSNCVEGVAPDYTRIIPAVESMTALPLPPAEIRNALACARVFAAGSMNTLRISRTKTEVVLHASDAELGDYDRAIPVEFENSPDIGFEVGLNARYFAQALSAAMWDDGNAPLELLVQTPASPVLLQRKGFSTVIMPMHIGDRYDDKKSKAFKGVVEAAPAQPEPASEPKLSPAERGETFSVPTNGIANTDPIDMDAESFEAWASAILDAHKVGTPDFNTAADCINAWRRKRADAQAAVCAAVKNVAMTGDPYGTAHFDASAGIDRTNRTNENTNDLPKVFEVTCECGTVLEVRDGNSAVCQCGAIVDDKGSVIFKQDPESQLEKSWRETEPVTVND